MAILYGTQSNGETLPVEVNEFGQLVARGIEGPTGPPGPPGVGELPPGAFDGAVLGWENGELVWFGSPIPPQIEYGFRPVIYSGNGGTQSITGVGFSPDLVWCKATNNGSENHALFDTIRGATKVLYSNLSNAEATQATTLSSFDADGFSLGGGDGKVNKSGIDYISWCWDSGDTTVINNDGSIESQVRSNGNFSVVKYSEGASYSTVGHGLASEPKMIIARPIDNSSAWIVYHYALGKDSIIRLNTSDAAGTVTDLWGTSEPTSTVFGVGVAQSPNNNSGNVIAYAWAETPNASSFGEYIGGSIQTINTDFRPSLVIIKSTGEGDWFMFDNARGASEALYANEKSAEAETGAVEFLDDGFQLLVALPGVNESNTTYIYAAFANPQDAAFAQRQLRRQATQEERQQNETSLR